MGIKSNVFAEYEQFLKDRKLVNPDHATFFVHWVRKFFDYAEKHRGLPYKQLFANFAQDLENRPEIEDWQLRQALDAVSIFQFQFRPSRGSSAAGEAGRGEPARVVIDGVEAIERLREIIWLKHYSPSTERTYLSWTQRFYDYCERANIEQPFSSADVKSFLTFLAMKRKVSASTQNQAFSALLLLARQVLHLNLEDMRNTVRAKPTEDLPVALTKTEVRKIFELIDPACRLIVMFLYGSGLRLKEVLRLRVKDLDFEQGLVMVKRGKGGKDRTSVLPEKLRLPLLEHLKRVQQTHQRDLEHGHGEVYVPEALSRKYPRACRKWSWQYVFPAKKLSVDPRSGVVRRHRVQSRNIQNAMSSAVEEAGIHKHATVHSLRHSFATHMLLDGTDIREIQELLGHKSVETTMVYTHVVRSQRNPSKSPLDGL